MTGIGFATLLTTEGSISLVLHSFPDHNLGDGIDTRRYPLVAEPRMFDREQLAWAAGFFDGEGSTCSKRSTRCGEMTVPQKDPECLYRFQKAVGGLGAVDGPYRAKTFPIYVWRLSKTFDVDCVLTALWPWLSGPKRRQAEASGFSLGVIRQPKIGPQIKPAHLLKTAQCHPGAKHVGKGLCNPCYLRQWRAQKRAS